MGIIRNKKKAQIDFSIYSNNETGGVMLEELKDRGVTVKITEATNEFSLSSKNYSMIDNENMLRLMQMLSSSDLGNVLKISLTTKTLYNAVYNNNIPHTNKTLQKYLEFRSESQYYSLIKRLINIGVLYKVTGLFGNEVQTVYIMNPYLCRKRKTFSNEILDIIEEINIKSIE